MINTILNEANNYLDSEKYFNDIESIGKLFSLSSEDEGHLSSTTSAVIIGSISELDFIKDFVNASNMDEVKAKSIFDETMNKVIVPFKRKIAHVVVDHVQDVKSPSNSSIIPASDKPLRTETPHIQSEPQEELIHFVPQPAYQAPITTSRPADPLTKDHILSQIENPPRTVVKKYVIEHEPAHDPITNPDHLIDDTIKQRAKLEAHYKD